MDYNWKNSLDKWRVGIPMSIDEMQNLSDRMECSLDERCWIDLYIANELELQGGNNE